MCQAFGELMEDKKEEGKKKEKGRKNKDHPLYASGRAGSGHDPKRHQMFQGGTGSGI